MSAGDRAPAYVSRAGVKLEHALREFRLDVRGLHCADLGCHAGGFTDCLLQHGAASVHAVDTGYGVLDWRLRSDDRVVVMERTNALHVDPPRTVDLVVIDLGWTPQRHALPAAVRWLAASARIISLVKPHYELTPAEQRTLLVDGRLEPDVAERIAVRVMGSFASMGLELLASCRSPITGAKSGRGRRGQGNIELLALSRIAPAPVE